ncbi:MAG: MaoC/PaaZ C-terminal domain-containing protein [SAR324 cluster bacterium]|nr:MaoC/PaaZ C-terminal domain-containing protein [SAR324 cluster bacterium]
MPIDPQLALGQEFTGGRTAWTRKDIVLYQLSLGAGNPPNDPGELAYAGVRPLKVLPTFAVIPTSGVTSMLHTLPGLDFDPDMRVHGEHDVTLHRPIPEQAKVTNTVRITDIFDKGKGALVVMNIDTRDESGELLFSNRRASFVRGEGGFGGEPGPKAGNFPPERTPDLVAETPTLPQQALLYNLASGDENPLHTDPDVARKAGFDKPIIHGLCTFGMVCKTVVDYALQGDPARIKRYQARFSGVVFPGETLETAMWMEEDRIVLNTRVKERGTPAISNAAITLHG